MKHGTWPDTLVRLSSFCDCLLFLILPVDTSLSGLIFCTVLIFCTSFSGLVFCTSPSGLVICTSLSGLIFCTSLSGLVICTSLSGPVFCTSLSDLVICTSLSGLIFCTSLSGLVFCTSQSLWHYTSTQYLLDLKFHTSLSFPDDFIQTSLHLFTRVPSPNFSTSSHMRTDLGLRSVLWASNVAVRSDGSDLWLRQAEDRPRNLRHGAACLLSVLGL